MSAKVYEFAFSVLLYAIYRAIRLTAWRHRDFADRLRERNLVAQMRAREGPGRYFVIREGTVSSRHGIHPAPDVTVGFKSARLALRIFLNPGDQLGRINAAKTFSMTLDGPEDKSIWFMFTLESMVSAGWRYGIDVGNGETRYCNMANGGPLFVYVRDGKIVRMTPIVFDGDDPQPWSIRAKGKTFTPPRKTTLAPHGQNVKSIVYSPDRLLHPMKRVDFDPDGERNPENRGGLRLRAHKLGRSARYRRKRDQAAENRSRTGIDCLQSPVPSHVGQHRLLPERSAQIRERGGNDRSPPQPG